MVRDFGEDSFEFEEFENAPYECEENDDSFDSGEYDGDYEWTMEDSWDALTDGMYGDMPNNPMDYDLMMEALGF